MKSFTLESQPISGNGHCHFHHGNILVLDQQFHLTRALTTALQNLGFKITSGDDWQEVLELLQSRSNNFDLVIADQNLPDMSGSEPLATIMRERPDIPLVLCSGSEWAVFFRKIELIKHVVFLSEPTEFRELIETVGAMPGNCHAEERRMLVAGDRYPMTRMIGKILQDLHFRAIGATDHGEQWESWHSKWNCFDLILADQNYKDMTDSPLICEVMFSHPEVPIILCTREHEAVYCGQSATIGEMEFLSDEKDFQEFLGAIDVLLRWTTFWELQW